eukprot:sb/3470210/
MPSAFQLPKRPALEQGDASASRLHAGSEAVQYSVPNNSIFSMASKRKSRATPDLEEMEPPSVNRAKRNSICVNGKIIDIKQPACEGGVRISFNDITAAAYRIKSGIVKTPLVVSVVSHRKRTLIDPMLTTFQSIQRSDALSKILGCELYFKKEFELRTGSFKERGARNALLKLSPEERKNGVIAASAGNHALALAYHGQLLGIKVLVAQI